MAARSDADMAREIGGLFESAGLSLDVDVHDGVAEISGPVESPELRQAAIDLARMVQGVREVDDQTEDEVIAPDTFFQPGGESDDAGFTYADRESLRDDLSDTEPDFAGNVGAGAFYFQDAIEEAEPYFPPTDPVVEPSTDDQDIRVVGGFQDSSTDEVATAPDASPGDEPTEVTIYDRDDGDILDDVVRELREDALTNDLELTVDVINGVVFLQGTVPTLDDAENAESVAGRVPGVVEVRDNTTVVEEE